MNMRACVTSTIVHRSALLAALLFGLPLTAAAQNMPTPIPRALSNGSLIDRGVMPGMEHNNGISVASMAYDSADLDPHPMSGLDEIHGPTMGPMPGGNPPSNARSSDYSDGVGYGSMKGMDMNDNAPMHMLLIDQLETFYGRSAHGQRWQAQGWYGNDANKLWLRPEVERSYNKLEDGDLEAFWNHNIAAFWSTQLGARQDFGEGPKRTWAAFGIQGLAPYWFELEATGYVEACGRTAARLRVEYELLFTQRLILQPEAEINLYGKNDRDRRIGRGISDVQFALRLRYEIYRQFAPYVGVIWARRMGATADYARQDFQPLLDQQIVAGIRIWF